ncbi:hypothetical protein N8657_00475 [bacterium]|nr:hypothetical protein [bacterium]
MNEIISASITYAYEALYTESMLNNSASKLSDSHQPSKQYGRSTLKEDRLSDKYGQQ